MDSMYKIKNEQVRVSALTEPPCPPVVKRIKCICGGPEKKPCGGTCDGPCGGPCAEAARKTESKSSAPALSSVVPVQTAHLAASSQSPSRAVASQTASQAVPEGPPACCF